MTRPLYRIVEIDGGWTWWDGFAFEPNVELFPTRQLAQDAANRMNADTYAWNRAGLADAPHMDNY